MQAIAHPFEPVKQTQCINSDGIRCIKTLPCALNLPGNRALRSPDLSTPPCLLVRGSFASLERIVSTARRATPGCVHAWDGLRKERNGSTKKLVELSIACPELKCFIHTVKHGSVIILPEALGMLSKAETRPGDTFGLERPQGPVQAVSPKRRLRSCTPLYRSI